MNTLRIELDPRGVATLTLARADKHNALSGEMIAELSEIAQQIAQDDAIRVVILAAEGRTFCAGGDLRWMQDMIAATSAQRRAGVNRSMGNRRGERRHRRILWQTRTVMEAIAPLKRTQPTETTYVQTLT